jgi:hypothetical protein
MGRLLTELDGGEVNEVNRSGMDPGPMTVDGRRLTAVVQ